MEQEKYILIKETQEKPSDIFVFGVYVLGALAKYWNNEIETTEKWLEIL